MSEPGGGEGVRMVRENEGKKKITWGMDNWELVEESEPEMNY